jgi:hypothetical protein
MCVRMGVMTKTRVILFLLAAAVCGGSALRAQPYYPPGPPPGYYPGYRPRPPGYNNGPQVERAVYGARGRFIDVTEQVRRLALRGIRFRVSNDTFGFDPYKGREKKLRVTLVRPDGVRVERSWDEGDIVLL